MEKAGPRHLGRKDPFSVVPSDVTLKSSIFQDMLELLVGRTELNVTFEDLTGFTFDTPDFSLEKRFRQHCSSFCTLAKSDSIRSCLRNKWACNRIALSRGSGFSGICRLGLWEAVAPLIVGGKALGVFYFGSVVLKGSEALGEERIRTFCKREGLDPACYLAEYAKTPRIEAEAWEKRKHLFAHTVRLLARLIEELAPPFADYMLHRGTYQARAKRRQSNLSRKAIDYVSQHFAGECTLNETAKALGCHPVHLSRTFKADIGIAFHQHVHRIRIVHAKRLLATRNMNVTRVAYEVGYADSSHFCRVFKQSTGQTPAAFVRNTERV